MEINNPIQCKNCPWKVSADLSKIPNYDRQQHLDLNVCIPEHEYDMQFRPIMSCHNSTDTKPEPCIGFLYNQLNIGNNIPLRLRARKIVGIENIVVVGEQLETFEETLRNEKK